MKRQNKRNSTYQSEEQLTPEEEAPDEAAEEVSTDAAQEEFDVIGGSDNKPEQL